MDKGIGGHTKPNQGEKDEWLTPPWLMEKLGRFDLDPCAPAVRPWDTADQHFTIQDDGLSNSWFGRVWCNPPYGQQTGIWLERCADHGNTIALVFARTETEMFFQHVWPKAHAMLFIEGRLFFHHVDGKRAKHNSGGPSVLIAYGKEQADFLERSDIKGAFIRLKENS